MGCDRVVATNYHYVPGTCVFSEDRVARSYSPKDSSPYQETATEVPDVSAATLDIADADFSKGESNYCLPLIQCDFLILLYGLNWSLIIYNGVLELSSSQ